MIPGFLKRKQKEKNCNRTKYQKVRAYLQNCVYMTIFFN